MSELRQGKGGSDAGAYRLGRGDQAVSVMRKGLVSGFLALSLLCSGPAWVSSAHAEMKTFGEWEVNVERDRFGGSTRVIAMLLQGGHALAVRCFPTGVSVAIGDLVLGQGRFTEGMIFDIKFRADDKSIITTLGGGLNDKMIQVDDSDKIFRDMRSAKEYAFRITFKTITFDMVFSGGKGAARALGEVAKACGISS